MTKTSTNVAIIGAGIAGSWLAYRLAQRGIETVVIRSDTAADTPTVSQGAVTRLDMAGPSPVIVAQKGAA